MHAGQAPRTDERSVTDASRLIRALHDTGRCPSLRVGRPCAQLVATCADLAEEPEMRAVVTARWFAALKLPESAHGYAAAATAGFLDLTRSVAEPILAAAVVLGTVPQLDPDTVVVGYDGAPIIATGVLPHQVRVDRPAASSQRRARDAVLTTLGPALCTWFRDAGTSTQTAHRLVEATVDETLLDIRCEKAMVMPGKH